jgi:hypothetical protein
MIIGIDPGTNGGTAIMGDSGALIDVLVHSAFTDGEYASEMNKYLNGSEDKYGLVEKVHAMPSQGVASSFKFGAAYGKSLMTLSLKLVPFELVTPQQWQKELGITKKGKGETKTKFKKRLAERAQQLHPRDEIGREEADAVLIATAAYRRC